MESSVLAQLLRLPPGDRADLAMALWESLSDDERKGELALSPAQRAELDRRWADHEKRPDNVVPWSEVRRKLLAREGPDVLFSDLKQRMKSLRLGAGTKNDARDLGRSS